MTHWFYASPDGQRGPVDETELRRLVAAGDIGPETLVWHAGMADWEPLRDAAPDFAPPLPPVPGAPRDGADDGPPPAVGPTFAEIKRHARHGPEGNFGTFLGASLLLWLAGLAANALTAGLAGIVLTPAIQYGTANLSLRAADHRRLEIGDAFLGFQQFGRAFAVCCVVAVYLALWALLPLAVLAAGSALLRGSESGAGALSLLAFAACLPGAVAMLAYSMAPFVAIDRPDLGPRAAVAESARLMAGRKLRLVLFGLSFLGWYLLVAATFGLAGLWVWPYVQISTGAFYRSIAGTHR